MMGRTSLLDLEHAGSHREPFLPIFAQGATQGSFLERSGKKPTSVFVITLKKGRKETRSVLSSFQLDIGVIFWLGTFTENSLSL
jgi:hypothetical protein